MHLSVCTLVEDGVGVGDAWTNDEEAGEAYKVVMVGVLEGHHLIGEGSNVVGGLNALCSVCCFRDHIVVSPARDDCDVPTLVGSLIKLSRVK